MAANDPGQPPLTARSGEGAGEWSVGSAAPSSALAIGAHPDDVEFGAGGTLARWAAEGCRVHYLVCTDGSKGTWDPDADIDALVATRRDEQRAAAAVIAGAQLGEVRFLGCVDGELDSSVAVRAEVVRRIRALRPQVVLGHDPWKRYRLHPDHRHAGQLACDAVVAARDPHFHRDQGLAPHRPDALLLWEADVPDHVEDVSTTIGVKLSALAAHRSQFRSTMHAVDEAQLERFRRDLVDRHAELGRRHGFAAAEVFARISDL